MCVCVSALVENVFDCSGFFPSSSLLLLLVFFVIRSTRASFHESFDSSNVYRTQHAHTQTETIIKKTEKEWNIPRDSVCAKRLPSEPVHNRDL